jgi:hypothetical protein
MYIIVTYSFVSDELAAAFATKTISLYMDNTSLMSTYQKIQSG